MKNKKIITLIIFSVIIILAVVIVLFSNLHSNQEENLNETNTNNRNEINILKNDNNISENTQNAKNQFNTEIATNNQNNIQTSQTNMDTTILKEGSENVNNLSEEIKINLIVNNKTFTATLNNNETARELVAMFPMTLNMSDLHSNEKYNYLDSSFTTNSNRPSKINAGDIKLYENNCLVVFYESFSNSYSYTHLGKVDNIDAFVSELGSGSVNIRFELAN